MEDAMMQHMQMGKDSMSQCPMMKGMKGMEGMKGMDKKPETQTVASRRSVNVAVVRVGWP